MILIIIVYLTFWGQGGGDWYALLMYVYEGLLSRLKFVYRFNSKEIEFA